MGYKITNITHLLDKTDKNHNKQVVFKVKNRFLVKEYQILPYQEAIFDSNLLPLEIKKMEMMGMIKCESISSSFIDEINNPKVQKKETKEVVKKEETKKRKTK